MPVLSLKELKRVYASANPQESVERIIADISALEAARDASEREKLEMPQDASTSRARGALTRKINGLEKDIELNVKALDYFRGLVAAVQQPTNVQGLAGNAQAGIDSPQAPAIPPGLAKPTRGSLVPAQGPGAVPKTGDQPPLPPTDPPGLTKPLTATTPIVPPILDQGPGAVPKTGNQPPLPPTVPPGLTRPLAVATPIVPPIPDQRPGAIPKVGVVSPSPALISPGQTRPLTPAAPFVQGPDVVPRIKAESPPPPSIPPGLTKPSAVATSVASSTAVESTQPAAAQPGMWNRASTKNSNATGLLERLHNARNAIARWNGAPDGTARLGGSPHHPPFQIPRADAGNVVAGSSVQTGGGTGIQVENELPLTTHVPPRQQSTPYALPEPGQSSANNAGTASAKVNSVPPGSKLPPSRPHHPPFQIPRADAGNVVAGSSVQTGGGTGIQVENEHPLTTHVPPRQQITPYALPESGQSSTNDAGTASAKVNSVPPGSKVPPSRPRPRPTYLKKVKTEEKDADTSMLKSTGPAKGITVGSIPPSQGQQGSQHLPEIPKPVQNAGSGVPVNSAMADDMMEMELVTPKDEAMLEDVRRLNEESQIAAKAMTAARGRAQGSSKVGRLSEGRTTRPNTGSKSKSNAGMGKPTKTDIKRKRKVDEGESSRGTTRKATTSSNKKRKVSEGGGEGGGEGGEEGGGEGGEEIDGEAMSDGGSPEQSLTGDEDEGIQKTGTGKGKKKQVQTTWIYETRYKVVEGADEPQPVRVRVTAPARERDEVREAIAKSEAVALHNYLSAGVNFPVHLLGRARKFQGFCRQIGATSRALVISTFIHQNQLTRCHRHLNTDRMSCHNDLDDKKQSVTGVPLRRTRDTVVSPQLKDDGWWETYKNAAPFPARIGAAVNPDRIPTLVGGLSEEDMLHFFRQHEGKHYLHCGCNLEDAIFDFFLWKTAPDLVSPSTGAVESMGVPLNPRNRSYMIALLSATGFGPHNLDLAFKYNRKGKLNDLSKAPAFVQNFWKEVDMEERQRKAAAVRPKSELKPKPPKEYVEVDELHGPIEKDFFGEEEKLEYPKKSDSTPAPGDKDPTFRAVNKGLDDEGSMDLDEEELAGGSVTPPPPNPGPGVVNNAPPSASPISGPPRVDEPPIQDHANQGRLNAGPVDAVKTEENDEAVPNLGPMANTTHRQPLRHVEENGIQVFILDSDTEEGGDLDGEASDDDGIWEKFDDLMSDLSEIEGEQVSEADNGGA